MYIKKGLREMNYKAIGRGGMSAIRRNQILPPNTPLILGGID